ncbi:MAG: hypothetical protein H6567_05330 [Lewinellaceae bacterium]|nr:hypothetical protein [Lewinellaceae bacterium]
MMAPLHIQVIVICPDGFVLAYEIGHGKFWLRHPDNDLDHLGDKDGDAPPLGGPFNINDINNFMYHTSIGRVNRIRHYQWKKILTSKYKEN